MILRKILTMIFTGMLASAPICLRAQAGDQAAEKNAQKARVALASMVEALGGDAWLNMKNQMLEGQIAAFFHGNPDPGTTLLFEYHSWPDRDRIEATKHRDVLEFFTGNQGWEVTYRGKKPMDKEIQEDFLRRRDHSIETAVKVWLKDPNTILIYEGQHMAERHLAEQVTLISPKNDAVTILLDAQTHLPLQRIFQWRDPVYHDKNTDTEEYDDYHLVNGIQTPYTITRLKNDELVRQFYVTQVRYNQNLPGNFWNPDDAAHHIARK